jgi:hypothetical protein
LIKYCALSSQFSVIHNGLLHCVASCFFFWKLDQYLKIISASVWLQHTCLFSFFHQSFTWFLSNKLKLQKQFKIVLDTYLDCSVCIRLNFIPLMSFKLRHNMIFKIMGIWSIDAWSIWLPNKVRIQRLQFSMALLLIPKFRKSSSWWASHHNFDVFRHSKWVT